MIVLLRSHFGPLGPGFVIEFGRDRRRGAEKWSLMELEVEPRSRIKTREYPHRQVRITRSSGAEIRLSPNMFTCNIKHPQAPVTRRIFQEGHRKPRSGRIGLEIRMTPQT